MKENREQAISETLKWEGGYTNHPADPGGPTNWGITIIDARKYWKKDATASDVKAMPKSVAIDIYRQKYWKTKQYDCDTLPTGVDLCIFDYGVNSGPGRAAPLVAKSIDEICDSRLAFLKRLKTWPTFGKGWARRVAGIRAKATEMAAGSSKHEEGSAGAVIMAGTGTAIAYPHLWAWILGGTVIGAIAVYIAVRIYKLKRKTK